MYDRPPAMKPRVPSAGVPPGPPRVGGGIPPGTGGVRPPMPPTGPPLGGPSPGPIPFTPGAPPAFTGAQGGGRPPVRMGTVGTLNDMPARLGGGGPMFGGGPVREPGPGGNPTLLPPMGPRGMQPPMTPPALAPGLPPGAYGNMPKSGNLPGQRGNPYDTSMPDDWRRRAQRQTL